MEPKDRLLMIFIEVMKKIDPDVLKIAAIREDDIKKSFINSFNSVADKDKAEKEFKRYEKKNPTDFPFNIGC